MWTSSSASIFRPLSGNLSRQQVFPHRGRRPPGDGQHGSIEALQWHLSSSGDHPSAKRASFEGVKSSCFFSLSIASAWWGPCGGCQCSAGYRENPPIVVQEICQPYLLKYSQFCSYSRPSHLVFTRSSLCMSRWAATIFYAARTIFAIYYTKKGGIICFLGTL